MKKVELMKTIYIAFFFLLLVKPGFAQTIPYDSLYLGQTPPGSTPKAFPLNVNKGFFAAERIAISNDGKDIYYSEIKSYYPIRGENIKRYTFEDGNGPGPSICLLVMPQHFPLREIQCILRAL